jgi:hypothetical protein
MSSLFIRLPVVTVPGPLVPAGKAVSQIVNVGDVDDGNAIVVVTLIKALVFGL